MSDEGVIRFNGYGKDVAAIYVHYCGSFADEMLDAFFEAELADSSHDNRFDDPSCLAARFVVWYRTDDGLGIGIVQPDAPAATTWRVYCESSSKPRVERC